MKAEFCKVTFSDAAELVCSVLWIFMSLKESEICSEGTASLPDFLKLTGKVVVSPVKSVLGSLMNIFFMCSLSI